MTGRNKFSDLKKTMGASRVADVDALTKTMLGEMLLPEIRRHSGLTQQEVADLLGISQPSLSKIENQDDMQIGTLSKLIEAMGGRVEIIAHFPFGDCRLTQFGEATVTQGNHLEQGTWAITPLLRTYSNFRMSKKDVTLFTCRQ